MFSPQGLYIDGSDNLYLSGSNNVKKIAPNATLTATYTSFSGPFGLQVNSTGQIYLAEKYAGAIKIIDAGVVSTFTSGLSSPSGIAFDASGNLYVSEQGSGSIRKISSDGSTISTFATGLNNPNGITFDQSSNLYIAESGSTAITKITPDGTKTTYVTLNNNPQYLAFDNVGNLYVSNNGNNVNKIVPAITNVTTVVDSGSVILIATPATGETIDWYDQPSNGTSILTDNTNYTTPFVRNTSTYYAEARNTTTGCISSARAIVPITVNYNTLNKNGKRSLNAGDKINKNGAVGGTGVTNNGRIIN